MPPIVTKHDNEETDLILQASSIDDGLSNSILEKMNQITGDVGNVSPVDDGTIIGSGTLEDGGFVGKAMYLVRCHLTDSLKKQEITKEMAGTIYGQAVVSLIGSSIEKYKIDSTIGLEQMKSKALILESIIGSQIKLTNLKSSDIDRMIKEFNLKELMPLDREIKKEEVEIQHVKHETDFYNLNNLLPKQLEKANKEIAGMEKDNLIKAYQLSNVLPQQVAQSVADTASRNKEVELKTYELTNLMPQRLKLDQAKSNLAVKELQFKTYEFTEMLPLKKTKLSNEALESGARATEANAKADIMGIEKLIKEYYHDNIQPEEKTSIASKARIDAINAALNGNISDSLPYKRMTVLDKQQIVYDKQINHYSDQKNLDLLKIITNYQSMIYPDLTGDEQAILDFANNYNACTVYSELAPENPDSNCNPE